MNQAVKWNIIRCFFVSHVVNHCDTPLFSKGEKDSGKVCTRKDLSWWFQPD